MPSQKIRLQCHIKAPVEKVYDFFCDHESFARIWPGKTERIKVSDNPEYPNDVGSIRRITVGPVSFEETNITVERPSLIEYTITKGGPIKNHLGRIQFSGDSSETHIDYSIEFDAKIPLTGGLIASSLEKDWAKGIPPIIAELEAD